MADIDRRTFLKLLAATAAIPAVSSGCAEVSPGRIKFRARKEGLVIRNATVISMEKGAAPQMADVAIRGNRILSVGPAGQARIEHAEVFDASGKFLIPSLIDCHSHMIPPLTTIQEPLYMAAGVTTTRDMATPRVLWGFRGPGGNFNDEGFAGPRIITVAGFFDGPPGVFSWAIIPKKKSQVERLLDEVADHKIKSIKIYSYMSREMLKIIAAEATRRGLYIPGHVPLALDAREAADIGMNEFQHNIGMPETILKVNDQSFFINIRKYGPYWLAMENRQDELRALAADLKRHNVTLTPTLTVMRGFGSTNVPDLRSDPRLKYVPEFIPEVMWGMDNPMMQNWKANDFEACRKCIPISGRFTQIAKEEGVTVLAGTDCPASFSIPGYSVHDELKCLVELAKFTPEEALASATREGARVLQIDSQLGTISAGKVADMTLLDRNPLEDITAVADIRALIFNGKLASKETIGAKLMEMEKVFRSAIFGHSMTQNAKRGTRVAFRFIMPTPPGGWENQ